MKLSKFKSIRDEHPLNKYPISVTEEVSKLILKELIFEHPENIEFILFTLFVLNISSDINIEVKEEQSLNNDSILITFLVSKTDKSKYVSEEHPENIFTIFVTLLVLNLVTFNSVNFEHPENI